MPNGSYGVKEKPKPRKLNQDIVILPKELTTLVAPESTVVEKLKYNVVIMGQETELLQRLIAMMCRARRQMFVAGESKQITPVQGMVLVCMKPGQGKTMNELSEMMGCDASNITGLAEKLKNAGYLESSADVNDKRVKKIQLTDDGEQARKEILGNLQKDGGLGLSRLTSEELQNLYGITAKLTL